MNAAIKQPARRTNQGGTGHNDLVTRAFKLQLNRQMPGGMLDIEYGHTGK